MVTKEAIEKLLKDLNLPKPDEFSQDWQYEVANWRRVEEFIKYYLENKLNKNEKFTLMSIILESVNDSIQEGDLNYKTWEQIEKILIFDTDINAKIVEYWACEDDEIEDCFYITPLIRKIKEKIE